MRLNSLLILTLVIASLGCDSSDTVKNDSSEVFGTFELISIGGKAPPALTQSAGQFEAWTTEQAMTFERSGSFTSSTTLNRIENGVGMPGVETGSGTYTRNGTELVITFEASSPQTWTISNNEILRPGTCQLETPINCPRVFLRK